jgi:hypothetical protein
MTAFERAILLLRQSVDLALEAHKLLNTLVFTIPTDERSEEADEAGYVHGPTGTYRVPLPSGKDGSRPTELKSAAVTPVPANPGGTVTEHPSSNTPPGQFLDDDGTPLSVGMGWYDKALGKMMFYAGPCHRCNRPATLPFEPRGDRGGWYTCIACYRESRR